MSGSHALILFALGMGFGFVHFIATGRPLAISEYACLAFGLSMGFLS